MFTKLTKQALKLSILYFIAFNANSAVFFQDSFETGDYSKTNPEGFSWTDNSWTSIVSATEEVADASGVLSPPRNIANAAAYPGGDWTPHSGDYSMRFRYRAGEAMSEQRFDLGTPHADIWISFWLRVPVNYAHGPVGDPNKLFALWMDGYSQAGDGSTFWLSMWRDWHINPSDSLLAFTYSLGGNTSSVAFKQEVPFIKTSDSGRWMQMVIHIKAESSPGSSDGVVQTFRRWNDETSFTTIHSSSSVPLKIPVGGPKGFKAGYILGWANAAYTEDTEWLMDDFILSTTPLVIAPKNIDQLRVE
ncbi:MAG: hypothetical protein P8179_15370 [Candidatus Thiodiazotropha sp.]